VSGFFFAHQPKGKSMACSRSMTYWAGFRYIIGVACSYIGSFIRDVILMPVSFDWRTARSVKAAAYRKIDNLKLVYAESYETNGLSLDHRLRRC
jgi:hypothetical protein